MIMLLSAIKMELCITHIIFCGAMAVVESFLQELIAILVVLARGRR